MLPLSLEAAKEHLRVDDGAEDALIDGLIAAAADHVERFTGLVLTRRTAVEVINGFGAKIRTWPIVSIDQVAYVDRAGVDQLLGAGGWRIAKPARPARLISPGVAWPALGRLNSAVTLTMTAGYATDAEIPAGIVQALKMLVGHFYQSREAVVVSGTPVEVPMGVEMLLNPHRIRLA